MTPTRRDAIVAILTAILLALGAAVGITLQEDEVAAVVAQGVDAVAPDADTDSDPDGVPVPPLGD